MVTPKYLYFSFAVTDPEVSPTDPQAQVAIVRGSFLVPGPAAVDRIKAALSEWFLTPDGIDALEATDNCFTLVDLAEYYYGPIEDLLFKHGVIDLQIDLDFIARDINLVDPLNNHA